MRPRLGRTALLAVLLGGTGCNYPGAPQGAGDYSGTYCGTATTVTPGGTTTAAVTFSCSGGACADPSSTFSGTVSLSGYFSGSTRVCGACATFPMYGQMSTTSAFTISGSSGGGSSQTVVASLCGGGGGGGGGDTTPPTRPTGVVATPSLTRIDLSWDPATDDVGVTGYEIHRDGSLSPIQTVGDGVSTFDDGLQMRTQYCYTVVAVDAAGNRSEPSAATCATTPCETVPPSTPLAFAAVGRSESEIKQSWEESVDSGGGAVAGYRLFRDGGLAATVPVPVNPMTVTWIDGGLARLTRYCFEVEAFDTCDNVSGRSAPSCVSTLGVLAAAQPAPERIALDASRVYWSDGGTSTIQSLALAGGSVTEVASAISGNALETDGTNVFFFGAEGLRAVPAAGGTPVTLAAGVGGTDIAVDATTVHVAGGSLVTQVPIGGGAPSYVAAPGSLRLAVDATHAYWTEYVSGNVKMAPLAGGAVTTLASGRFGPFAIAVDATHVYWTEDGTGGGTASVRKRPKDLGQPTTVLASRPNNGPFGIAVDATDVYWIEQAGGVYAIGTDGTNFRRLVDRPGGPRDIAIDATGIYWVEREGQAVMMTLK